MFRKRAPPGVVQPEVQPGHALLVERWQRAGRDPELTHVRREFARLAGGRRQGPGFASRYLSGCYREPWVEYLSYRYWSNDRAPGFKTDCWLESSWMIPAYAGLEQPSGRIHGSGSRWPRTVSTIATGHSSVKPVTSTYACIFRNGTRFLSALNPNRKSTSPGDRQQADNRVLRAATWHLILCPRGLSLDPLAVRLRQHCRSSSSLRFLSSLIDGR